MTFFLEITTHVDIHIGLFLSEINIFSGYFSRKVVTTKKPSSIFS